MAHYKDKKGAAVKFKGNNDKNNKKADFSNKKPKFVNVNLRIAYSDFYIDILDSFYNILSAISFDKVYVPAKMNKSDLGLQGNGSVVVGNVVKFNKDNSITVSVSEENAKHITDKHVISAKCRKDFTKNEITFIYEFNITDKFVSLDEHFKDIEKAFSGSDNNLDVEDITDED